MLQSVCECRSHFDYLESVGTLTEESSSTRRQWLLQVAQVSPHTMAHSQRRSKICQHGQLLMQSNIDDMLKVSHLTAAVCNRFTRQGVVLCVQANATLKANLDVQAMFRPILSGISRDMPTRLVPIDSKVAATADSQHQVSPCLLVFPAFQQHRINLLLMLQTISKKCTLLAVQPSAALKGAVSRGAVSQWGAVSWGDCQQHSCADSTLSSMQIRTHSRT